MALRFRSEVCTTETDYGTVLLDQRSGLFFQLNPTGTLVVRTLLAGGEENDAVRALLAEFEVDQNQAAKDVTALVRQLRSSGLVTS